MAKLHAIAPLALVLGLLAPSTVLGQERIFDDGFESGDTCRWSVTVPAAACAVANPTPIDSVLINPGMGFANFHFRWWCNLPPVTFTPEVCAERVLDHWPENYPDSAVAYFRWSWSELEPVRGQIDFAMIDTAIQSANVLGETLSFRVMTIREGGTGVPDWLLETPYDVPGQWWGGTFWPDYRNATYQAEHSRFIAALGSRYNGHPAVDHVDIGTVGCWGEWNTACLSGAGGIFGVFNPQNNADYLEIFTAYQAVIDHHLDAFPDTPLVMLGLDADPPPGTTNWELDTMLHAVRNGAGWRVDCWGDWGFWGSWTHMEDYYPVMIANATAAFPAWPEVHTWAPVQLEICGTIPQWLGFGWSADPPDGEVHRTFQWALQQHASVLNAKFTEIPFEYVPAINDLLKRNGYRFTVDRLAHRGSVSPGQTLVIAATWSNLGVAPAYHPRPLTYRLKSSYHQETFASDADIRTWLPGTFEVIDTIAIPADMPPDTYTLELAILDRAGTNPSTAALPPLYLGIEGRTSDGWYPMTQVVVTD